MSAEETAAIVEKYCPITAAIVENKIGVYCPNHPIFYSHHCLISTYTTLSINVRFILIDY